AVVGVADEPVPETTEVPAEPEPWAAAVGALEGSPWAVGVWVGVEVPVAAVAIPPAAAMAVAVAVMSMIGRIRMKRCPFLRASG
ncbi:hypothetical protein, partial [Kitasatospora sp. NPDC047058]|uniref:hypothetical protein n=1 Tax=Kitasatospora sp. NPDC047058 TaxID=3155620 RepID=UPI0033D28A57